MIIVIIMIISENNKNKFISILFRIIHKNNSKIKIFRTNTIKITITRLTFDNNKNKLI